MTTIKISDDMNIDIAPDGAVYGVELPNANEQLAGDQALSAYDAAYLELSIREGLPLATRDKALAAAARRCGILVR